MYLFFKDLFIRKKYVKYSFKYNICCLKIENVLVLFIIKVCINFI